MAVSFDLNCTRCDRLAEYLCEIRARFPDYHARPVPTFGDTPSRFLIVGLAPGLHGANATGQPFTGDHAGILLYRSLFEAGFSSHPDAVAAGNALALTNCRITNAVRCLPPANKPLGIEVTRCNEYLAQELEQVSRPGLVLALGTIAHRAVLKAIDQKQSAFPFRHGSEYDVLEGLRLLSSYHCSRYNTQTGRLTELMFREVIGRAAQYLKTC
jgi:uracil-DNA glycosylase family 4